MAWRMQGGGSTVFCRIRGHGFTSLVFYLKGLDDTAPDWIKTVTVMLDKALPPDAYMVATVRDELILDCPSDTAEQ
jgi:hypothetical protein